VITIIKVDLENIPVSHSPKPDLDDPRRICSNDDSGDYEKVKYKATVEPSGTTAKVTSTGTAGVTFEGISGSNPNALTDGQEFWVKGGSTTGPYEITLEHNDLSTCTDTDGEKVFKFLLEIENIGGSGDAGKVDADTGGYNPNGGATIEVKDDKTYSASAKVVTEPTGLYSDDVECEFRAGFGNVTFSPYNEYMLADLNIYRNTLFDDFVSGWSASVGVGPVSLSLSVPSSAQEAASSANTGMSATYVNPAAAPQTSLNTTYSINSFPAFEYSNYDNKDMWVDLNIVRDFDVGSADEIFVYVGRIAGSTAGDNAHTHKARTIIGNSSSDFWNSEGTYEIK